MSSEALYDLSEYLIKELFKDFIIDKKISYEELTIRIPLEKNIEIIRTLKNDLQCRFTCLIDISGVDYPNRENRFDICYHLLSPYQNLRIRIKIMTNEIVPIPSISSIYSSAEWYEREIYDMYGVLFSNHPDMRRILTDYGFVGYPLRKDFPTSGFVECFYNEELRRVVYQPINLDQEMRDFDFQSPWPYSKK